MTSPISSSVVVTPVILCGGSGTRLWPLSRAGFPKQFLCLDGSDSLLQKAGRRLQALGAHLPGLTPPVVVTNEAHRFIVKEQLQEIGVVAQSVILEPEGKNTAPALTLAALAATGQGLDPVLVVVSSDQTVVHDAPYVEALTTAVRQAEQGELVILGVTPARAETGYGYIKTQPHDGARPPGADGCSDVLAVAEFVEKPDARLAQHYLDCGGYLWNAGIFVLRASLWLQLIDRFKPEVLLPAGQAWSERKSELGFERPESASFALIPAESIDYAVMEPCVAHGQQVSVVPLDAGWSDLGSWDSVWESAAKDEHHNALQGNAVTVDAHDSLIYASHRMVAAVGVKNLVVVETADAVLVMDKSHSQDVKKIVQSLERADRTEHAHHRKVYRPWGWYDSIDEGTRFKVKRIQVKPGASLSLQKHFHRAEHWVVVQGTALIVNGDQEICLTENQSTYIPLGAVHRLSNPGKTPLEIVEIQSGSYLGEDDIVRFDDQYGRVN